MPGKASTKKQGFSVLRINLITQIRSFIHFGQSGTKRFLGKAAPPPSPHAPHAPFPSMSLATEQSINTPETSVRVAKAGDAKLTGSIWTRGWRRRHRGQRKEGQEEGGGGGVGHTRTITFTNPPSAAIEVVLFWRRHFLNDGRGSLKNSLIILNRKSSDFRNSRFALIVVCVPRLHESV